MLERTRNINASGTSNNYEQNHTPEVNILDDTTHISTGKPFSNHNAVSSIIRNLSKKSHDLVPSFTSRSYTEKGFVTAASTDSEESRNDKINIQKGYSEHKGLNIEKNCNKSKIPTNKDVLKLSISQRNFVQDWDAYEKKNDLKIDLTDDGCWDNEIKISPIDENVNKIYMNNGNHISDVIDFTDEVIEIIDTVKPEKTNKSTDDIEIDHKESLDTVLNTEPMNEAKEKQDLITENIDIDSKNSKESVLRRPLAKLSNVHKFQMISVANVIILSMLFGTVIARKLENLDSNELVK